MKTYTIEKVKTVIVIETYIVQAESEEQAHLKVAEFKPCDVESEEVHSHLCTVLAD